MVGVGNMGGGAFWVLDAGLVPAPRLAWWIWLPNDGLSLPTGMPSLRGLEIAGRCQDHGLGGQAVAGG